MFEKSTSDARPATDTHRCLAGAGCRAHTVVDGQRIPKLTEAANTLCDACFDYHRSAVKHLPRDWAMLRTTLGERQAATGDYVKSSSTPAILINTTSDRLMVDILEWADRAAAVVSEILETDQPDGARKLPKNRGGQAEDGSLAQRTWDDMTQPHVLESLKAFIAIVEPHLDELAAAPASPAMMWLGPARCPEHAELIERFEKLGDEIDDATMQRVRLAAANCDDCNGWSDTGQARTITEITGLEILTHLAKLHHLTRKHLGHTRLRHRYSMPCPRCGHPVGRDDGATVVDCQNDKCGATWTEREYKFLAGLVVDEGKTMETLKYLVAESYSRLDQVRDLTNTMRNDDAINLPGAGTIILDALTAILTTGPAPHLTPDERRIATDKNTATERQTDDDNWAWKHEKPYTPPKPKRKRTRKTRTFPVITTSSLTTINEDPTFVPGPRPTNICPECNLVHAGDC